MCGNCDMTNHFLPKKGGERLIFQVLAAGVHSMAALGIGFILSVIQNVYLSSLLSLINCKWGNS